VISIFRPFRKRNSRLTEISDSKQGELRFVRLMRDESGIASDGAVDGLAAMVKVIWGKMI
jgi:hypothetical protein